MLDTQEIFLLLVVDWDYPLLRTCVRVSSTLLLFVILWSAGQEPALRIVLFCLYRITEKIKRENIFCNIAQNHFITFKQS